MEIDLGNRIIKITAKARKIDLFKEPRQFMDFHEVTGKIRFIRNDFIHEDNGQLSENIITTPRITYYITKKSNNDKPTS